MEITPKAPSPEAWLKKYVDQHFADFFENYGGDLKSKYTPQWIRSFFNAFIDLEPGQATQFVIPSDLRQFFLDHRTDLKIFLVAKAHNIQKFPSAPPDIQQIIENALNMLENAMRSADGIPETTNTDMTAKLIRERILFIVQEENLKAILSLYTSEHLGGFLKKHPFNGKALLDPQIQFTYFVLGQYDMDRSFVTYLLQNSGYLIQDIKTKFSGESYAVLLALETYFEKKMDEMKMVTPPLSAIHFRPTEPLPRPAGGVDRNAETPIPRPRGKDDTGRDAPVVSQRKTISVLTVMAVIGIVGMIKKDSASTDHKPSPRVSAPASPPPPRLPDIQTSVPEPSRIQTPPPALAHEAPRVSPPPISKTRISREPRLPHKGERLRHAPAHRPQQTTSPSPAAPEPVLAPAPQPLAVRNIRFRQEDGRFQLAAYTASGSILGIRLVLEGDGTMAHIEAVCRGKPCRSQSFSLIARQGTTVTLH